MYRFSPKLRCALDSEKNTFYTTQKKKLKLDYIQKSEISHPVQVGEK